MLRLVLPGCFFLCGFSSLDDGWCFLCERIVNKGLRFEKKIKHATLLFIWTSNLRLTSYSGTPTHRLVEQNHHPKIQKHHDAVEDVTCMSGRTGNAPCLVIHTTRPSPLIAASMVHWMSPMIIEVWKEKGLGSGFLVGWPLGKGDIRKRSFLVLGWKKNHGIYHIQKWKVSTVKVA